MIDSAAQARFRRMALLCVATIYTLILIGGVVRASGAGMGCPDWPTCFGRWIPPTAESQLPPDYQQIYADRGYAETTFNVTKTWTEYLNRLAGVFTGITILISTVLAWPLRHRHRGVFGLTLSALLLVMVQGWIGAQVVASNLHPGMITLHMLLAQLIVALVILAVLRAGSVTRVPLPSGLRTLLIVAAVVGLVQLLSGTQVREAVDLLKNASAADEMARHLWIENLPAVFAFHKWFVWVVLAVNLAIVLPLAGGAYGVFLQRMSWWLAVLLMSTTVIGFAMDQLHLPAYAQPLHLWLASLIFGTQFAMIVVGWGRDLIRIIDSRTMQKG